MLGFIWRFSLLYLGILSSTFRKRVNGRISPEKRFPGFIATVFGWDGWNENSLRTQASRAPMKSEPLMSLSLSPNAWATTGHQDVYSLGGPVASLKR